MSSADGTSSKTIPNTIGPIRSTPLVSTASAAQASLKPPMSHSYLNSGRRRHHRDDDARLEVLEPVRVTRAFSASSRSSSSYHPFPESVQRLPAGEDTPWEEVSASRPFRIFYLDGFALARAQAAKRKEKLVGYRHSRPPWFTCNDDEANEEHPMYAPWVQEVGDVPPFQTLLQDFMQDVAQRRVAATAPAEDCDSVSATNMSAPTDSFTSYSCTAANTQGDAALSE